MHKFFSSFILTFALLNSVLFSSSLQAADRYIGDNSHTEVIFRINHLGFSTTYGRFTNVESEIVYDEKEPSKSTVSATIYTDSVDLGHAPKTEHMKKADFFNVTKYSKMTFKSTKIKAISDKQLEVVGDLTLLDVTKSVTMNVTINKIGTHPIYQSEAIGFSATGSLDRTQWGLSAYAPMVGKEVNFNIEFEGTKDGSSYENKFNN